jgi:hypothetical protein
MEVEGDVGSSVAEIWIIGMWIYVIEGDVDVG